jgi:transcriptional regulator with XRE-family HTH domain
MARPVRLNGEGRDELDGRIEVRATGLKAMREKKGLTQRKLALGISQNYIPAIEAGARRAGPKPQEQLVKYFGCRFDELFQVVFVDSETGREQVMEPISRKQ